MSWVRENKRSLSQTKTRRAAGYSVAILIVLLSGAPVAFCAQQPQEPTGEVIGTIEGKDIAVKGPMSVQVVGNEVKTLLRSGVDIRVKAGRARINLTEGGTIAVCGPAHISMLKAGNVLTVALDSGTVHAHVDGSLTLNIFTAQILAKTVAIGDGPQDALVGFDTANQMCVRSGRGALRLEEQFGGQTVMVPQGGDVTLINGQLQGMRNGSGLCACESFEPDANAANPLAPEISTLATSEEVKRNVAPRKPAPRAVANPAAPEFAKPAAPAFEPTYQVYMPPLSYDASKKVQDEPDPQLIVLVRRVRVRPTLIFQSRVEGDALLPVQKQVAVAKEASATKAAAPASASVVDRVKTFFKNLWTPNS
ncbi:MAG TPA: hypothetical protein VGF20_07525 [Candidatus Acidoferrum sp.]|jgi:hypothetical protein